MVLFSLCHCHRFGEANPDPFSRNQKGTFLTQVFFLCDKRSRFGEANPVPTSK